MRKVLLTATALLMAASASAASPKAVVETYAAIAQAGYDDSLTLARTLRTAVGALTEQPSATTLAAAKAAWVQARVPYQQTEVFRFGNPIVDDWEGKVNAWPLDEGLIDYTNAAAGSDDDNPYSMINVIANPTFTLSGHTVDATTITPQLLQSLHEIDGIEANVATGYHAIEFLLWGQDLNGVGPGGGARPYTDYDVANCTGGHCARRAAYLIAATELLITDLEDIVATWSEGGEARTRLSGDASVGLSAALTGMGSLSYGELAGERMKLGVMLHDPEEEQDCFSDNTHNAHYYAGLGIRNVWHGRYVRIDGSVVEGASPMRLVAAKDAGLAANLSADIDAALAALGAIKATAEAGMAYDQMLAGNHAAGEALILAAVDALTAQTRNIERVVAALHLSPIAIAGSDSLDHPAAVFE